MSVIVLIALFLIYFFPTMIASSRGVKNKDSIFVINLFLGWTLVFWVIALSMAYSDNIATESSNDDDEKDCPFCAEKIKLKATICKHCRQELK